MIARAGKRLRRKKLRRTGAAAVLAAALYLAAATAALAHATLLSSTPRDGAMVATAPSAMTLTFNEPVAPLVFRLAQPGGGIIDLTGAAQDRTVTLKPPQPLGDGTYALSWRVVSADGHPVGGSFLFSVGAPSTTAPTAAVITTSIAARGAIWLTRVAIYLGLFIGIGGVFFIGWLAERSPSRRIKRTIAGSLGLALVAVPVSLGLQGIDALAAPLSGLWQPAIYRAGFHTSYGNTALFAAVALIAGLVALVLRSRMAVRALSLFAVIGAGAALAASGHASAAQPQWLMRPSVFFHVAAIALWAGSLLPLFNLLSEAGGEPSLRRFSRAIPLVVALLAATGVVLAVVQIGRWGALWDTAYGNVFLAKCVALIVLAALAIVNRYGLTRAVMRGDTTARSWLRRSVAAEIGLVLVIFGIAALWRFTPPPRALAHGEPAFVHLHGERAMTDITVTPGHAGPVSVTIHVMREDFQPLDAREVTLRLSNKTAGLEPLVRKARRTEPGEWRADGISLLQSGIWTVELDILVSDFDRLQLDGPVVIAPSPSSK
jgi:copper transport protein